MSYQTIGTCSLCGGDVVGFVGAWWATIPPPPARCSKCGAEEARGPVIPMKPATRCEVTTTGFVVGAPEARVEGPTTAGRDLTTTEPEILK